MEKFKKKIRSLSGSKKDKSRFINSKNELVSCTKSIPIQKLLESSTVRLFQNCLIVWLDKNINDTKTDDFRNNIIALRRAVNCINLFNTIESCLDFIRNIQDETVFMIISGVCNRTDISIIHDLSQLSSIYIFYEKKCEHFEGIQKWPKVRNIYTDLSFLSEAIKQAAYECDRNTIPISFIDMNDNVSNENFVKFTFTQLVKEIVLSLKLKENNIHGFITYYRTKLVDNVIELKNINKFGREYEDYVPIWWYTYPCFLASMLNRALRTMDVITLIKMDFFICDLHHYIVKQNINRQNSVPFIVYRGQGLLQKDFDQLKKVQNQFIAFNNFLLASKFRTVAMNFARQAATLNGFIGVVFCITVDPVNDSISYANIHDATYYPTGEDFIFSINSLFRIGQIKRILKGNIRIWQVELILTSSNDSQVKLLNERVSSLINFHHTGWCRLSEFFIHQNQLNKSRETCDTLMTRINDEVENGYLYYQLGLIKFHEQEYSEAKSNFNLSLQILKRHCSSKHTDIAPCYNQIGLIYEATGEYSQAISFFEKAMEIYEESLLIDNVILKDLYIHMAKVYFLIDDYPKSLLYYEKVIQMYNTLLWNHSDIVICYQNMALIYEKMNKYSKAISYLEKTLPLLKENSSDIAKVHINIGTLYKNLEEHSIALTSFDKAFQIYQEILSDYHPDLSVCYNNIGMIYFQRGHFLKALSFYEKAHEIYRRSIPLNPSDLAKSYSDHGAVYEKIGNYTKALLYYKKTLETYQQIHPINYHDLAMTFNKIGLIYFQTREYPAALACHEKALDICRKNLSQNHSELVFSYICLGDVYDKMDSRSEARSFYKSALDIGEVDSSSVNHICPERWNYVLKTLKDK